MYGIYTETDEKKFQDTFWGHEGPSGDSPSREAKARWERSEAWAHEAATECRNAKAAFKIEEEKWLEHTKKMDL